jgi:hypothetical protein
MIETKTGSFIAVRFFVAKTPNGELLFAEDVEGKRTAISRAQYLMSIKQRDCSGKYTIEYD